jgi:hypothetical protein
LIETILIDDSTPEQGRTTLKPLGADQELGFNQKSATELQLNQRGMRTKTRICAWEQPTKIETVKSMRENSRREQITETTAGEGTESFLVHHATGEEDRSQANKEEA